MDSCFDDTTYAQAPATFIEIRAKWVLQTPSQVNSIALESTGIYWIPLFELLESEGFEVPLVDPSYSQQLRGRPKTDRRDCQWIYRLHSVGLLAAAFRPDEQLGRMKCDRALPPLKPKAHPKRRVNSPGFEVRTVLYYVVGLDLTEIEGIRAVALAGESAR